MGKLQAIDELIPPSGAPGTGIVSLDYGGAGFALRHPAFGGEALAVDGSADWSAVLEAASTAVVTAGGGLIAGPGTYAVDAVTTIACPLTLLPGAKLKPASGIEVTLPADFRGSPGCLDISAGGSFVFAGQPKYPVIPQLFGATVGASGRSSGDDTDAIVGWLKTLVASSGIRNGQPEGFLPAGIYRIEQDNLFGQLSGYTPTVPNRGLKIRGEGMFSSIFFLVTGGSEKWLYDTLTDTKPRFDFMEFESIGICGDSREHANGFRIWSAGGEKIFRFNNCAAGRYVYDSFNSDQMGGLNAWCEKHGTGNADQFKHFGCSFHAMDGPVLVLNNNQAVCDEFHGCDFSLRHDLIQVLSGGGGNVSIFGGSVTIRPRESYVAEGTTDPEHSSFLLRVTESQNIGAGNNHFNFYGTRVEFGQVAGSGVVYAPAVNNTGSVRVVFSDMNMTASGGIHDERLGISLGVRRSVIFRNCNIPDYFTYELHAPGGAAGGMGEAGVILWEDCRIPQDLVENITITDNLGRAVARGCFSGASGLTGTGVRYSLDFDLNGMNSGRQGLAISTTRAVIRPSYVGSPLPGGTEWVLNLPPNRTILSIHVRKPASGASTATYQLHVGNGDKSTTYASSTSDAGQMRDEHLIHANDLWIDVGTDVNNRVVRLWATGDGSSAHAGGYAVVEYI